MAKERCQKSAKFIGAKKEWVLHNLLMIRIGNWIINTRSKKTFNFVMKISNYKFKYRDLESVIYWNASLLNTNLSNANL